MMLFTIFHLWKMLFTIFHLAYLRELQSEMCLEASNFPQTYQELWFQTPPSTQNWRPFFLGQVATLCPERHRANFLVSSLFPLKNISLVLFLIPEKKTRWEFFCCCFFLIWCECGISLINEFTSEREQNIAIISMHKMCVVKNSLGIRHWVWLGKMS